MDLPEPDGPVIAVNSPCPKATLTSSRATTLVWVVTAGEALIAPSVTRRVIHGLVGGRAPAPAPGAPLRATLGGVTDREREVLTLVGQGLSNAEIAAELRIGVGTVKTHMARLLAKLDARDRVRLVILACESGLLPQSP